MIASGALSRKPSLQPDRASVATPIVEYTDKVVYLEDGEIAVLHLGKELKVVNLSNVEMTPEIKKVELNLGQLEKGISAFYVERDFRTARLYS